MKAIALSLVVLVFPSCASMFQGGPDTVPVSSSPPGATVKLDGQVVGRTPMTMTVKRKAKGRVTIELAGYLPYNTKLDTSINATTFLNLLLPFGPIWLIVDGVSGNFTAWDDAISVTLTRSGTQ